MSNKKRMSVWLNENTYEKTHEFAKNNDLITNRVSVGLIVEIALNLFFTEVEKRPIEDIVTQYLTNDGVNVGGLE